MDELSKYVSRAINGFFVALFWIPLAVVLYEWHGWTSVVSFSAGVCLVSLWDLWQAWKVARALKGVRS